MYLEFWHTQHRVGEKSNNLLSIMSTRGNLCAAIATLQLCLPPRGRPALAAPVWAGKGTEGVEHECQGAAPRTAAWRIWAARSWDQMVLENHTRHGTLSSADFSQSTFPGYGIKAHSVIKKKIKKFTFSTWPLALVVRSWVFHLR